MAPLNNPAMKRLKKELEEIEEGCKTNDESRTAISVFPIEDNFFEWHFTMSGPDDSEYSDGLYHGCIKFPTNYPFAPPNILFSTPSGRFQTDTKICLSVTGFHPESWQPAWSTRTILLALRHHMAIDDKAVGSIVNDAATRKQFAKDSHKIVCKTCGYKAADMWANILRAKLANSGSEADVLLPGKGESFIFWWLRMLPECPDDLKFVLPYLQRASELKARDPVVAYYCGFYAANLALQKGFPKTPANDGFLMALLDELSSEKEALKNEPAISDNSAAKSHMIQFALKIFLAADNEDRAGQATKKTARLFLVASHFMEVLRVFGEAGEEIEERIRYAKWKAADIVKALNEGRQPIAGPPGQASPPLDETHNASPPQERNVSPPQEPARNFSPPSTSPPVFQASPPPLAPASSPPLYPPPPTQSSPPVHRSSIDSSAGRNLPSLSGTYDSPPAPPPIQPPQQPSQYVQQSPSPPVAYAASIHASLDLAEKHSRYATSAIQFEDIPTAIKEMETAISILKSLQR